MAIGWPYAQAMTKEEKQTMTDIQKLGEVAALAQEHRFTEAQRLANSINDTAIKAKAQDIIDCVKGVTS